MLRKILVLAGPGADSQRPAIARAAALAEVAGAALVLLDVVYEPHLEGYLGRSEVFAKLRERMVAERRERLQALAAELEASGLRCEAKVSLAHPTHMGVAREAAAPDVDLVVFEPEDARGLSSDEWRLVSISPAPVLVVRDAAMRPYVRVIAAVDPERSHAKPADLDGKILGLAKCLRDLSGAQLEVIHCLPSIRLFMAEGAAELGDVEKTLKEHRERELDELVEQAGLPKETAKLIEGKPADVLVEMSSSDDATLLVLGTVQRGPLARLLVGSTAERVLRPDGGDVVVIRPAFVGDSTGTADDDASSIRRVEVDPSELG